MPTTTPPAPEQAALRSALEATGWRCTPQRGALSHFLGAAQCHLNAKQVYQAVSDGSPRISLAAVCTTFDTLAAGRLVSKITSSFSSVVYDERQGCRYLRTGRVEDVPIGSDLALVMKPDPDFTRGLAGSRLELLGDFDGAQRPEGGSALGFQQH